MTDNDIAGYPEVDEKKALIAPDSGNSDAFEDNSIKPSGAKFSMAK